MSELWPVKHMTREGPTLSCGHTMLSAQECYPPFSDARESDLHRTVHHTFSWQSMLAAHMFSSMKICFVAQGDEWGQSSFGEPRYASSTQVCLSGSLVLSPCDLNALILKCQLRFRPIPIVKPDIQHQWQIYARTLTASSPSSSTSDSHIPCL